MSTPALSFESDIKPLFREKDRTSMSRAFDLWSATDVAAHGQAILARLQDGSMPCDGAWPTDKIDTLATWLNSGTQP